MVFVVLFAVVLGAEIAIERSIPPSRVFAHGRGWGKEYEWKPAPPYCAMLLSATWTGALAFWPWHLLRKNHLSPSEAHET
jgi:hypothetical protein